MGYQWLRMTFPTVHWFVSHLFWFPYRPFLSRVLLLLTAAFSAAHPPLRQVKVILAEQRGKSRSAAGIGAGPDCAVLSRTPLVSTQLRCSWERVCPFLTSQWLRVDTERPLGGLQWCSFHSNYHCSTCDNMISHLFLFPFLFFSFVFHLPD